MAETSDEQQYDEYPEALPDAIQIDSRIWDRGLNKPVHSVPTFMTLARFADPVSKIAVLDIKRIANVVRLSPKNVRAALADLEAHGLITMTESGGRTIVHSSFWVPSTTPAPENLGRSQ